MIHSQSHFSTMVGYRKVAGVIQARKIHEEDSGGSSGHEGRSETWWKGGLWLCILQAPIRHSIAQPENQLLKEAGETDSGPLQPSLLMLARPARPVLSSLYH